jgi:hypothetical protein
MKRLSLQDETGTFDVTVGEVARSSRAVLFAVGAGGNPERHAPLLEALVESGCSVVAPHFERLVSPNPTDDELLLRARRLTFASHIAARADTPIAGVGHSIGATVLLALAGGQVWTRPGQPLPIVPDDRIDRLALMAPATGFFLGPGALNGVRTTLAVWVGALDTITPPDQAEFLKTALDPRVRVDLQVLEGAGHFSFMNVLPPHVTDPLPDRQNFLDRLQSDVCRFTAD